MFPTPIWWADLDIDNEVLKNHCYDVKEQNSGGREYSNRGGYQSNDLSFNTPINILLDNVIEISKTIFNDYYKLQDDDRSVYVCNHWININGKNHFNIKHTHPNSFLSGVYYVETENVTEQGSISFHRSEHENFILSGWNVSFDERTSFTPVKGRLILFPSYFPHSVLPNHLDNERISVSFNVILK